MDLQETERLFDEARELATGFGQHLTMAQRSKVVEAIDSGKASFQLLLRYKIRTGELERQAEADQHEMARVMVENETLREQLAAAEEKYQKAMLNYQN